MKLSNGLLPSIVAIGLIASCGQQPAAPATEEPTSDQATDAAAFPVASIDETGLRDRIATLASDDFGGRAPATRGGEKTREYLIEEMQNIGLEPANGDSYEQAVPLIELTADPEQSNFSVNGSILSYGDEVVYWTKRVEESVSFSDSDLVFVGYGVVAPEFGWNDYEGIDVTGKTVVILVNDPGYATQDPELFKGRSMTYYGRWTYKYEEAARQGAAAAIVVHQTEPAAYGWGVVEGGWTGPQLDLKRTNGGADRVLMEGWVQESVARRLFSDAGLDFDAQLAAAAEPGFSPVPMTGLSASGSITNNIRESSNRPMLQAFLRGAERPDEYVLYMAHWDHLGTQFLGRQTTALPMAPSIMRRARRAFWRSRKRSQTMSRRRTGPFFSLRSPPRSRASWDRLILRRGPVRAARATLSAGSMWTRCSPRRRRKTLVVIGNGASELEDLLRRRPLTKRDLYLGPDANPEAGYFYRSDHISLAKHGVPMLYAKNGDRLCRWR